MAFSEEPIMEIQYNAQAVIVIINALQNNLIDAMYCKTLLILDIISPSKITIPKLTPFHRKNEVNIIYNPLQRNMRASNTGLYD